VRSACLSLAILSLLSSDVSVLASNFSPLAAGQHQPTFKAEAELVVLHVSVRDRGGRYITGLDRDAFTVIDDGKPQTLSMFSADDVPASVGLLIDNSNSMRPNRDRVIASAVEFVKHSHPKDETFVLTFNEHVRHAWGPSITGDTDPGRFASAMSSAIVARGMTAVYDATLEGLKRVAAGNHPRQVLIAVSDGDDNASKASRDEVLKQVQHSDATIYTIALIDPLTREGNPQLLRRLARATGGESYRPRSADDISEAFSEIARDIRSAYTLAYTPTTATSGTSNEQPRRRTVRVYVRSKDGRALRVRTRDGYYDNMRGGTR
jgi:Ca-activated chloride channel family protein